jgi:integral membrane protein
MRFTWLFDSFTRFRYISLAEGISYLLLLGIAMPLKYFAGLPEAVQITGWVHGVLFVAYMAAGLHVALAHRWKLGKVAWAVFASLLPFGPILFDRKFGKDKI